MLISKSGKVTVNTASMLYKLSHSYVQLRYVSIEEHMMQHHQQL